jgi:hypothetical protein
MRRRVRFLRKARELAYRDLGGLVFNLHRFGERNDALVLGKLSALTEVDSELRELESALKEHRSVTVLHEAGVTACPRCAAIHSGEDRFCPSCGLPLSRHVDLPVASASGSPAPSAPADSGGPSAGATGTPGAAASAGASGVPQRPGASASRPASAGSAAVPGTGPTPAPGEPGRGAAPLPPVHAPGSEPAPPLPPVSARPSNAPPAEPPPGPPPAPAVPAEDQPTKVIRPARSKWRLGSKSK